MVTEATLQLTVLVLIVSFVCYIARHTDIHCRAVDSSARLPLQILSQIPNMT